MRHLTAAVGAAALTFAAFASLAQPRGAPSRGPEMAGVAAYQAACAACHDGGDERAPELEQLQRLDPERVRAALKPGGLMASQASGLTAEQHGQLVAFLGAPAERRVALAMAARNSRPDMPGFSYPLRRVRDPRDTASTAPRAQAWAAPKLGAGPFVSETWEQRNLRAVVVARGLDSPRAIEFLPNGDVLVAERAGRLRIVRDGVLDPNPVKGMPAVAALGTATGFMDIKLHPDFAKNGLVYLAYHKPAYGSYGRNTIYRARWTGAELVDGQELFVADDLDALYTRLMFGPDGKLYATIGCPGVGTDESIGRAQKPDDYAGKVLRLNADGTVPRDNPFVGRKGYNPEIFTLGHRVNLGLALNPRTGQFWVSEHGPNGGDEVNILKAGQNYGWPLVSEGRYYAGPRVSPVSTRKGVASPHLAFVPSIAPGNLIFYTGDKFPAWKGNLFVGAMRLNEAPRTGHLLRIVLNEAGEQVRGEMLLYDLHQRIRDVEQSPDGLIWVTTDEGKDSVLMRLEPAEAR
ncbi:PQQ-dependent sugar dehydrogenase [Phenylobacterium sp.]|jgi:glucose/arabinose dehydrogenase|uniref:PQQ-dependent sugar dehydrogenase n=1 Tax=Phenylobacterium sp. TaxID=1871053 RepID=UPI002F933AFC